MSRIGNKVITLPAGVEVTNNDNVVTVKGPKGELTREFNKNIEIKVEGNEVTLHRPNDSKENKTIHGTSRANLNNMVVGVSEGFKKELEMRGVGYRAQLQGTKLVLSVGKSHQDEVEAPEGITFDVPNANTIIVKGIDNCLVKLSKCCNPLPGDEIIGYITKGRGVSVHRKDCPNVADLLKEQNRIIDVKWYNDEKKSSYTVEIEIFANDRNGLLGDIVQKLNDSKVRLISVNAKATKERIAITEVTLEVDSVESLNKVIRELRKIDSVYEVSRKNKMKE